MNNLKSFKEEINNNIAFLLNKYRGDYIFERLVKELVLRKNAPRAIRRNKLYFQLEWLLNQMDLEQLEQIVFTEYVSPKN